jgi:hypothetical protein
MNYEDDIRIDETALDVEWLEQPSLMMKYSKHAVKMRQGLDLAKEQLELVRAEIDRDVRMHPDRFGIEKITEAVVQNTILMDDRFKKANEFYITTKYETDVAQVAVRAFEHRKEALENLVRLNGQQYFAGPKVPRDLTDQRAERQKRINAAIASRMKRRSE